MVGYHVENNIHWGYDESVRIHEDYIITDFLALIESQQRTLHLLLQDRARKLRKLETTEGKDKATPSKVENRLAERLNPWRSPAWRSKSRDRLTLVSIKICLLKGLTD